MALWQRLKNLDHSGQDNEATVAHAVAASAAYPAMLPAIDEAIDFVDRKGAKHRRRVLLADGGVYDNLGVTCLEPGSAAEVGYNRFAPDYIICCDAGQGVLQDYPVPYLWGPRMVRVFESVFRKTQNGTRNRLHLLAEVGKIKGFVMPYLGQIDERLPYAPADLVRREDVFEYPTDFGPMKEQDISRIAMRYDLWEMADGYYVTITNRLEDLPPWFGLHPTEVCGGLVYKMMAKVDKGDLSW